MILTPMRRPGTSLRPIYHPECKVTLKFGQDLFTNLIDEKVVEIDEANHADKRSLINPERQTIIKALPE